MCENMPAKWLGDSVVAVGAFGTARCCQCSAKALKKGLV